MRAWLSDEVVVLLSPVRGYDRLLKDARPAWRSLGGRAALFFLLVGAALSFTSAGRLVAAHALLAPLGWAFLPLAQMAAVAVCRWASGRPVGVVSAWDLYLAGNGPLYALALGLAAVVVLAPDPGAVFAWSFQTRLAAAPIVLTLVASWATSYGFHRACLGASRLGAAGLLLLEWLVKLTIIVAWYQTIDNLLPQLLGARGAP